MGFVRDLVRERKIIRELWEELGGPGAGQVYAFVEQGVMGGRVEVEGVVRALGGRGVCCDEGRLEEFLEGLRKNKHLLEKYSFMRVNRLNRKK